MSRQGVVNPGEIARLRLAAQGLVGERPDDPAAVVRAMGAMQGQDLPGAMTSVALRTSGSDPALRRGAVVDALNSGAVVRSWTMRGTLHLVPAEDLGSILSLTGARMRRATARNRELRGVDEALLDRARSVTLGALAGGRSLARGELMGLWEDEGLLGEPGRGYRLLFTLAIDGDVCWGPFAQGEQRVVGVREWITAARNPDPDEALAQWVLRYFRGHGPATVRDFAWWTKLPLRDVRAALAAVRSELASVTADGGGGGSVEYFLAPETPDLLADARRAASGTLLLPGFDEFLLGYGDRSAGLPAEHAPKVVPGNNGVFRGTIVANGRVVGTWKRAGSGNARRVAPEPFTAFTKAVEAAVPKRFAALP